MFDRNGDRRISARELAAVIRQALGGGIDGKNAYLSEEELIKLIQEADLMTPTTGQLSSVIASNGTLEFDDFLAIMHQRMQEVNITEEVIEAFRVFDKERTGFVQIDDVKKIL
jgi:Ca2+-binding EF-hand superfamily protein